MDLRQYFRKIREVQTTIAEPHVYVASLETSDGGKAGVVSEVSRSLAARMIVEGRAALASKAEIDEHLERQAVDRQEAQRADLAKRLQIAIVSDNSSHLERK